MIKNEYELLDSGHGRKLERFGPVILARPCAQAVWAPMRPELWGKTSAEFDRKGGLNWKGREALPRQWVVPINGLNMKLAVTDFGHIGVFPETRALWDWITATLRNAGKESGRRLSVLNLFAYSGGATLAAARAGCEVCHLDASKGMTDWARENAALNELQQAPIRWIVDDVHKFLAREIKRGRTYDAVMLDPPSFGRGKQGELYKIEQDMLDTLKNCRAVMSERPVFMLLTSHTPGFSPIVLKNLLEQQLGPGAMACGEMLLTGAPHVFSVPNGNWARWVAPGLEA
ncbi:MAG TPA: class I SAM-dependent methyltransferase [Kiritimatiellia bacterium]|nr:class I SAM-dependent methyltransferase [Kiritimatiellia bacterium]HMP00853.1 class I SAM-dependent methyltransferase [Kiritimatiellia bacterium]